MKHIFVFLIMTLPLSSYAVKWVERGNGGFVLNCTDTRKLQTVDIYEALQRPDGLDITQTESVDERMTYLFEKLERLNPSRAQLYRNWYSTFESESQLLANIEFSPVADIGMGIKPKNCKYELAIFQRAPDVLNSKRYVISKDIWDNLDVINKSALIMHELIYRELIDFYPLHQTSEGTRYFNGALNSPKFAQFTTMEYLTFLQALRIPRADLNGFTIRLSTGLDRTQWKPFKFKFFDNGGVIAAILEHDGLVLALNRQHTTCLTPNISVFFHPNGKIKEVDTTSRVHNDCDKSYVYSQGNSHIEINNEILTFNDSGSLVALTGSVNFMANPNSLIMQGYTLLPDVIVSYYDKDTPIKATFSDDGGISELVVSRSASLCLEKETSQIKFISSTAAVPLLFKASTFKTNITTLKKCKSY